MSDFNWEQKFKKIFKRCHKAYRKGNREFDECFKEKDDAFLESIGYSRREFWDFVEDNAEHEEPSLEAAILIAAVRRDYLRTVQGGKKSKGTLRADELPPRDEELGGYRWLPRIIAKARAKLRGELDPDTMYSCGGDRAFLREHDIHPADFLRVVWAADGDDGKIVDYVRKAAGKGD